MPCSRAGMFMFRRSPGRLQGRSWCFSMAGGRRLQPPGRLWRKRVSIRAACLTRGVYFDLPGLVIAIITAILAMGVRESANINSRIVFVKVGTVITFIAVVAAFLLRHPGVSAANWHPFIPPNLGAFGQFGRSGIARGAGVIFFAYIGFDAVSTAAQEAKNPQRDVPIGILGSLAICTALYLALGWMLTGVVNYTQLNTAAPGAMGIQATGVRWSGLVVMLGTFAGLTTTMLVMLLGQSRVFYAMKEIQKQFLSGYKALIWNDLSSAISCFSFFFFLSSPVILPCEAAGVAFEAAIWPVDHSDICWSKPHNRGP